MIIFNLIELLHIPFVENVKDFIIIDAIAFDFFSHNSKTNRLDLIFDFIFESHCFFVWKCAFIFHVQVQQQCFSWQMIILIICTFSLQLASQQTTFATDWACHQCHQMDDYGSPEIHDRKVLRVKLTHFSVTNSF